MNKKTRGMVSGTMGGGGGGTVGSPSSSMVAGRETCAMPSASVPQKVPVDITAGHNRGGLATHGTSSKG